MYATGGEAMFEKYISEKKPSFLAKQILQSIKNGELKPGQKLPNENEFVEITGISRSAVREALSALDLMDIIDRRPGNGTYVREDFDLDSIQTGRSIESENNELMVLLEEVEGNNGTFQALMARIAIEPVIGEIAAHRADEDSLSHLTQIFDKLQVCFNMRDFECYHALDSAFHLALAECTNNDVFVNILRGLLKAMEYDFWKTDHVWSEDKIKRSLRDHKRIYDALKNRDGLKVKTGLQRHFTQALKWQIASRDVCEEDEI